ncbi:Uncharacterised protein [Mycobacteroides abscessus]|nr:Uncharacterised protein [Mycobacteroides abscessus]
MNLANLLTSVNHKVVVFCHCYHSVTDKSVRALIAGWERSRRSRGAPGCCGGDSVRQALYEQGCRRCDVRSGTRGSSWGGRRPDRRPAVGPPHLSTTSMSPWEGTVGYLLAIVKQKPMTRPPGTDDRREAP